jgi:hypothetical protein
MRAREFIDEGKGKAKVATRHQQSTRGLHKVVDNSKTLADFSSDYTMYRIGMAAGCTDGITMPDIDPLSWIATSKINFPYSKADQEKLIKAYKLLGVNYKDINDGDMVSRELESTYTQSPVANWQKTNEARIKNEAATSGATGSVDIASVVSPHLSPGPARGRRSYTGSPGQSGTKAPPQPKPRKQTPSDNALDMSGSIFGTGAISRKRKKK